MEQLQAHGHPIRLVNYDGLHAFLALAYTLLVIGRYPSLGRGPTA